jgi:hypothetical protein
MAQRWTSRRYDVYQLLRLDCVVEEHIEGKEGRLRWCMGVGCRVGRPLCLEG